MKGAHNPQSQGKTKAVQTLQNVAGIANIPLPITREMTAM
jgi:hypothetical protein